MTKIKLNKPKKLILLRHGHSPGIVQAGVTSDEQRPLSQTGYAQVKLSAQKLLALKIDFDVILSSTLVRAEETSKILSDILGVKIMPQKELSGGLPASAVWDLIVKRFENFDNILVVGHQPYLGTIAGDLLYGASIGMNTAGFLVLEFKEYLPFELEQGFAKETS